MVDLTKKEREESAKLREELKNKRKEGGRWIIKKGKIVKLDDQGNESYRPRPITRE